MEQVAVCGVDLRDLEAGVERALGGVGERLDDSLDRLGREPRRRRRVAVAWVRPVGRADDLVAAFVGLEHLPALPGAAGRPLAPGVSELDTRHRPLRADERGDRRQRLGVVVAPDPEVPRRDAPPWLDRRRLGHDDAGTAAGATAEVDEMPVRRQSVPVLTGVLTHRRHHHPVPEFGLAEPQRVEQVRHRAPLRRRRVNDCRNAGALPVPSPGGDDCRGRPATD